MTRSSPATLAIAADYADAMLVARRAKNLLFLLLLLIIAGQMAIFFAARYGHGLPFRPDGTTSGNPFRTVLIFEWFIAVSNFAGVVLPIVLSVVLLLIVTIMLVGRLVGVSHVTGAFCWSVVLVVFLFPWQALLNSRVLLSGEPHVAASVATTQSLDASSPDYRPPDVRPPGALYTWRELLRDYDFPAGTSKESILKWARFVAYPFVMLVILFMVQARSSRGLRFALGEAEVHVEVTTTPAP